MRSILPAIVVIALGAGCYSAESPVAEQSVGTAAPALSAAESLPHDELFALAARTYDVPRDLLVAWAWHASGFSEGDHDHDEHQPGHGWMALQPQQIELATALTGYAPADVEEGRAGNILGAAAVLDSLRDSLAPGANGLSPDERWWPALAAFAALEPLWLSDAHVLDLYRTLQDGLDVPTADESVQLSFDGWDLPGLATIRPRVAPGEDGSAFAGAAQIAGARWVAASSSNQSARSGGEGAIRRIVLHTTEGSYAGAISWFQNPASSVSAHFVVRRSDGEVTQMVKLDKKAWHACNNNNDTIGIEQEGFANSPTQWTPQLLDASARLTATLVNRHSIPIDRTHIVGHGEIQPASCATRTDPGPYFPWDAFMAKVHQYATGSSPAAEPTDGGAPIDPGAPPASEPTATVQFESPRDGDEIADPVLARIRRTGGHHVELWAGAYRIGQGLTANPVHVGQRLSTTGPVTLTAKLYNASGAQIASSTVTVTVRSTTATVQCWATAAFGLTYDLDAVAPGASYVRYWVDGWAITDLSSGSMRAPSPTFQMQYAFNHAQTGRLLQARAYDASDRLIGEGFSYFDVASSGEAPRIVNLDAYESAGRLMRLTTEATLGVQKVEYRVDGHLLTDRVSGRTWGEPDNFELWYEFSDSGARTLEVTAYDAAGTVVDVQSRTIWVPSLDLEISWTRNGTKLYHFDADAPPGTDRVVIEIDGWALPDMNTGFRYAPGPAFEMDYRFNHGGWRQLRAKAIDPVGNVVDEYVTTIQVY